MAKTAMLRLYGGEYVMGEINEAETDGNMLFVVLDNPLLFVCGPGMGGSMRAGFMPLCIFDEKKTKQTRIQKSQIWLTIPEENLPKDIVNGYRSEISGIKIATDVPDIKI